MRMWMIDPKLMCRKHLLGEHVECHMILGCIKRNKNLDGYIKNNLIEIRSLKQRHKELAKEMVRRGYKHNSELEFNNNLLLNYQNIEIDKNKSLSELLKRCENCNSSLNFQP